MLATLRLQVFFGPFVSKNHGRNLTFFPQFSHPLTILHLQHLDFMKPPGTTWISGPGLHGQAHEVNATCSATGEGHHLFMGVVQSKPTSGIPGLPGLPGREPMGGICIFCGFHQDGHTS